MPPIARLIPPPVTPLVPLLTTDTSDSVVMLPACTAETVSMPDA